MLKNFAISLRMMIIGGVAMAGMVAVGLIGLFNLKAELLADRQDTVRSLVESANTAVSHYAMKAAAEGVSVDAAKQRAIATLRDMRFDKTNYFFILDFDATMVMHPISPQMEGKPQYERADPLGKKLFAEMTDLAKKDGSGFVSYVWNKPGETNPSPKLSYVMAFPEWKWVIGAGIYIDDIDKAFWERAKQQGLIGLIVLLIVAGCTIMISRGITRPLSAITKRMDGLAHGDLKISIPYTAHGDEVGDLARSLEVFKNNALRMEEMRKEQEEAEGRAEAERRRTLLAVADRLEASTGHIIDSLSRACDGMKATANEMSSISEETSRQASGVAVGSEEASANVQTVAVATTQLSSSIEEISRQVTRSSSICQDAVKRVEVANQQMTELTEAASQIGEVMELINAIAAQTNLLALNATIEAARAGEAGKGFAVVAGEVKALAAQTAKATQDIAAQVNTMQEVTRATAGAFVEIGKVIREVNDNETVIAAAIEQQGAATREISRNIEQASQGTAEVAANIVGVNEAARETGEAAVAVLTVSNDLSGLAGDLREQVGTFLKQVRTA